MKTIIQQPKAVKCKGCGCVFTFTKEDVFNGAYMKEGAFLGVLPANAVRWFRVQGVVH